MEKIAIVYSTQDPAGVMIARKIKELEVPEWAHFYEFSEDIIYVNADGIKENEAVFLSRHESESGAKSLTVHFIGNFGEAKFGGKSGQLCGTLSKIGANYLRGLARRCTEQGLDKEGFSVSFEATHHGPFTRKKCLFIEIGGSPKEWTNELGAQIIAKTIIEDTFKQNNDTIVVGLGGGHYSPDFTKLCLRKNYSFGHICPKHHLNSLSKQMLQSMLANSGATQVVLDWKGLRENKQNILKLCDKMKLAPQRVQNLLK